MERREQVTHVRMESTGNRRNSLSWRKPAGFLGWHEPDESRGSRPDLWGTRGANPRVYPANAGDLGKSLSSQRFGLYGQSPALIVIEAHSPATELFSKHPILLAKIFNDLQLAVVHPPGDSDQQKPE